MECGVRAPAGEHKTTIDPFFMVRKRYNSYRPVSQVTTKLYSFACKILKLHYLKLSKN